MTEERSGKYLRLEVSGPLYEFDPPPNELPVSVLQRTTSRGFYGQVILSLILAVDWAALASGIGINLFSQWLYDRFKRPHRDGAVSDGSDSRTEIKINIEGGNAIVVVLTDPQALETALRKIFDGT